MLEKITTDLETSKKLKELGFEADPIHIYRDISRQESGNKRVTKFIPAYTLEQILNALPTEDKDGVNLSIYYEKYKSWIDDDDDLEIQVGYIDKYLLYQNKDKNLATTAAKLWIKLKEEKII